MEPKKNPKYDVHKNSRMIFFFSLCVSILLVLTAFQWKRPRNTSGGDLPPPQPIYETTYPVPITEINIAPPKPEPIKEKPTYLNPVEATGPIFIDEPSMELPEPLPIATVATTVEFDEIPTEPDTFFLVEKMPLPKDGYEGLYKFLSSEMKYPKPAIRSNTHGKVYVEFVINKNGEPSNMRVTKGIGHGCDEEALRVIALTKWNPGKQRGVPVNVRMTLPIQFQLK